MKNRIVLLLIFINICGCKFPWNQNDPVIARVGDSELKLSEFKRITPEWDSLSEKQKVQMLESWINREVIYLEAIHSGIENDESTRLLLESSRKKIIVESYLDQKTDSLKISESEVFWFYDHHPELFLREDWSFSGIVIDYQDARSADHYFRKNKDRKYELIPRMNPALKNITAFDSLNTTPDSCILKDLRTVSLGTLSRPKYCKGTLKSILLMERLDSASLQHFSEVFDLVYSLAMEDKHRKRSAQIRDEAKNKYPVFSYPEHFH